MSCLEPGPWGARPRLNKCLMERKRLHFCMDEVSGQLQLVSTAEKLCLQCMLVQSVCVCVVCVVCLCACVHVGVLFVSPVFSQRRFTEYLLPPLATLPTTSLHHTTLVLICIRFTCPRCYSEGQEDGLVVPHADIGPDVIIHYRLLFIFRL